MIHVVIGPPCAGKTTYVREHAKAGDVIVDYDALAQALGEKEKHGAEGAIADAAYKARNAVINYLLQNEAEGWIIHSDPSEWQIKRYEAAEADVIRLDADEETCLEHAEADGRSADNIERIHEWFERHKKDAGRGVMAIKKKMVEVKTDNGTISGYASTWTREPDSYGDIVAKGAFEECIKRIKEEGRILPLLFNHDGSNLDDYIGTVFELEEDDHGLKFEATFDDTEKAQRARELAQTGRLVKFSFAYDVLDQGTVELEDGREANELRKLNIHEVSLVLYPANEDTSIISVKSGRRNSAKDSADLEKIKELAESILETVNGLMSDDIEQDDEENAKSKDPDTDNDKERERIKLCLKEAEKLLN